MALKDTIQSDLVVAMKAKEKARVGTFRLILAAIKQKEIDGGEQLSDEGVIGVLSHMVKQRKDSVDQFKQGGRDDLVAKEEAELAMIGVYLPEPLSEAQVEDLVTETIKRLGASSLKDMGAVIKEVRANASGQVDGKAVSQLVRSKLS